MSDLKGICVPICTPFDKSGDRVDEGALSAHVETLLDAGVHIIMSCGGTGEFAYLTEPERRRIQSGSCAGGNSEACSARSAAGRYVHALTPDVHCI